jgi:C1A family cysteine protease
MEMSNVFVRDNSWYGCRRDTKDARDKLLSTRKQKPPDSFDLRENCPPVMDQGQLGSCTAHGITSALRYLLLANGKPDVPLARLQLYYDERVVEGGVNDDTGAEIRDGIKCAAKIGVAHEDLWPYDIALFRSKPSDPVYADALQFEALVYERVKVSTIEIKRVIAFHKVPVVVGVSLFDSFESDEVARTGVVPMPDLTKEQMIGGHCIYVVGYGQKKRHFTLRNSWNTDWGDNGDFYLPEHYLGSTKFGSDYWAINTLK